MSTTADPGPSTGGTGEDRGNRSSSTATTGVARQPLTPASQTSRGFGRGRTGTPPAQTRIDSMFSSAQPSHVPVAEDIPSEHTALTGEETGEDRDERLETLLTYGARRQAGPRKYNQHHFFCIILQVW